MLVTIQNKIRIHINILSHNYHRCYVLEYLHFLLNHSVYYRRISCHVFYVLLTVHFDVILVNDQLDALFLNVFISTPLHVSSSKCSSSGGPTYINTPSGITHSSGWLSGRPVGRTGKPDSHPLECVIPDGVLIQVGPPDDEHLLLETCRGVEINTLRKSASSWSLTRISCHVMTKNLTVHTGFNRQHTSKCFLREPLPHCSIWTALSPCSFRPRKIVVMVRSFGIQGLLCHYIVLQIHLK